MGLGKPWGAEEEAMLRAMVDQGASYDAASVRIGRSPEACRKRASVLGIAGRNVPRRAFEQRNEEIRRRYDAGEMTRDIAAAVGATVAAVSSVINRHRKERGLIETEDTGWPLVDPWANKPCMHFQRFDVRVKPSRHVWTA